MIIDDYDFETEPIVNLESVYGKQKHLVDKCIIYKTFKIRSYSDIMIKSKGAYEYVAYFAFLFIQEV